MRRNHARIEFALLFSLATCLGCGDAKREIKTLRLEDVPPEVLKVARENLPGVEFDSAWQKASGTFELRGRAKNGKIREVDIRPDGTVEEVE